MIAHFPRLRLRQWAALLLASYVLVMVLGRTTDPRPNKEQVLVLEPLEFAAASEGSNPALIGAWRLDSPNSDFGGYSTLSLLDDDRAVAYSDRGSRLAFTLPGRGDLTPELSFAEYRDRGSRLVTDIEAAAHDRTSGATWLAYESNNAILKIDAAGRLQEFARPAAMRHWPLNSGPEGLGRLPDGRMIVLGEGAPQQANDFTSPGLIFSRDPLEEAEAMRFRFRPPMGYRATDMTILPSGYALILVRQVERSLPPSFAGMILLADPRDIGGEKPWEGKRVASLASPIPTENYEGIAAQRRADGAFDIWVISDDNRSLMQQTRLLRFRWDPRLPAGRGQAAGTKKAP